MIDRFARIVPHIIEFKRLETECLLVDGDRSALFGRIVCRHIASGRIISHRIAHFVRYRDGKVVSLFAVQRQPGRSRAIYRTSHRLDPGHRIDLVPEAAPADDNLFAL